MKTAENKTNSSPHAHQSGKPFFQKNGESVFFSDGQTDLQTKPFFSRQITKPFIQPKLKIGEPDDKYEKQADRVADAVVQMKDSDIQRQPVEEELQMKQQPFVIQRKCKGCEEEETLQKKADVNTTSTEADYASSEISSRLTSSAGRGSRLPESIQSEMSQKIGADFRNVNIHTSSEATRMSQSLGALAFTHGNDIYFNSGEYRPETSVGKHLLAHELTHVVQQGGGIAQIQKQGGNCQQPSSEQTQNVVTELTSGVSRMERYVRNPELIVGENASISVRRNIRSHIRHTIQLAVNFRNDLSSGNISFCITSNPCPNYADACFIPVHDQFRVKPFIFSEVNKAGVAALLHEYKHLKQHRAHAQQAIQSDRALIHGALDELNYEYEAALVGAIYFGNQIDRESSSQPQQPSTSPGELRERQGPGSSGIELAEERIPQEVLEYASTHGTNDQPGRSDLPNLARAYESQIRRNSPVIHYPVLYRDNHLILRNVDGDEIDLGMFSQNDLNTDRLLENAFWNSVESATYEQGNYRRGVLVIYRGRQIINQIVIHSRPTPAGRPIDIGEIEERPIQDITP